ncbi:hypothetical protein G6F56_002893 [Rhizopus delemar]|nr:hypothetical protein G6F56_002893 [Rhizopus delemar]
MRIAIEGCCHGELDNIYDAIRRREQQDEQPIDLVLICGDFQAVRNESDLDCMAVPPKFKRIGTFWKYYSGQVRAPYPTIFIGGNHEASNHLWELYHGGWVCDNIYFLGYAGVINFGGIRIGGLSGIFKAKDYRLGHYERPPYDKSSMRSTYHVREYQVNRVLQVQEPVDVFISHDWPRGIERYGDLQTLLKKKQYFKDEVLSNTLGSNPNELILTKLQPTWWFAAHLHVRYEAEINHNNNKYTSSADAVLGNSSKGQQDTTQDRVNNSVTSKTTKFLSLDKCLFKRQFLEVIDISTSETESYDFYYDMEWLSITKAMHKYLSTTFHQTTLPSDEVLRQAIAKERMNLEEKQKSGSLDLKIPHNFEITSPPFNPKNRNSAETIRQYREPISNPQTDIFCNEIGIENKINVKKQLSSQTEPSAKRIKATQEPNQSEIVIDEEDFF